MRTRGIDVAAELPASPLAALTLALLRHHGIAARYVSGYLFATGSGDGQESVEVDTHAWLEALLPVGDGSDPVRLSPLAANPS